MGNLSIDLALQNAGAKILKGGVTTFAEVFAKGELGKGSGLTAKVGGVTTAVQLDVKSTYEDGSVKMALLSVQRPDIKAGQSLDVTFATAAKPTAAAIDLSKAIASHSFSVDLVGTSGKYSIDVLKALQQGLSDGSASYWQNGALASQARVAIDLPGSQRMVFDVTAFKGGGLKVDAQFNNDDAMQARGGTVAYTMTAKLDGKVVGHEAVTQTQYQNWHDSFSTTDRDGGQGLGGASTGWLNIRHDVAHLQDTGAVAHYDLSAGISERLLSNWQTAYSSASWDDPMSTRGVTQYMPMSGGRQDIGITTAANTAWLMSQDIRAATYALGQAEAASVIPWSLWDTANGRWLSADAYPHLWTDGRGGTGTPGNANSAG